MGGNLMTIGKASQRSRRPNRLTYRGMLLPFLVLSLGTLCVPVAVALYLSFTNIQLIGPFATHFLFTGLENWRRLLGDGLFQQALWMTVVFVIVGTVLVQTVAGTAAAMLLRAVAPVTRVVVQGVLVVTWVIPEVVVGVTWYALAQPGGLMGQMAGQADQDLLITFAWPIVLAANVWHNVAFTTLLVTAGLSNIPDTVIEAARLDGCGPVSLFRYVQAPLLRTTFATDIALTSLQALSVFTLIYVMTQGGPQNATLTLPLYIYQQGFENSALGYSLAMSVVLMIIGSLLAVAMVRQVASSD